MITSIHPITQTLGPAAGTYATLLDDLVLRLDGSTYEFSHSMEHVSSSGPAMMQLYWTEMLYRCHWAAATTLIRARQWLWGAHSAYARSNVLSFSACARGLIEAAADSHLCFMSVPLDVAEHHRKVRAAIAGTLDRGLIIAGMEDALIHFAYATKSKTAKPKSHEALPVTHYLNLIGKVEPKLLPCYAMLCDLTHPGASSVHAFMDGDEQETKTIMRISLSQEHKWLDHVRETLQDVLPDVLSLGLNGAFVTLALLNRFNLPAVRTAHMKTIDLASIPAWTKVQSKLGET